ncbi:hypothetical protein V1289_009735 [Bradyrhizobium sp. AZCC 2289]
MLSVVSEAASEGMLFSAICAPSRFHTAKTLTGNWRAVFDDLVGASERSVGGTARPSALAVLKLKASSKWVGISIGRSPALAPWKKRAR